MRALLIAEKPSLKRTIEDVYKKHRSEIPYDITFLEQRGHLLTLKLPSEMEEEQKNWCWENLPFHPEEHGGWQYKIIQDKKVGNFLTAKERYMMIKDELKNGDYDFVINAGDPDQEGELLIQIVLSGLKNTLPVKRYWSNDTTEFKVLEALKNLKDDDNDPMLKNLLYAAYGRQHSDYRFGINISRAATLQMNGRVACGRVKTPILAIVCKREEEIKNFVPSTCYGVKVIYEEGFSGQYFEAATSNTEKEDDEKKENTGLIYFDTEDEAKNFISQLSGPATVKKFETKRTETYAPKLFKLASAQVAAGKLGYSSSETLAIIQSLYEKGYMSYPRTDCEYVSSKENFQAMLQSASCVPELRMFIDRIDPSVINKVRGTKKWVNDKELEKSGHSALVPTTSKPDFSVLSEDEKNIYSLICRQFVAIFLPPLIQDKVMMVADISGYTFKSTGKSLIDPGYTEIFGTNFTDIDIPEHKENDVLSIDSYELASKTTTCPRRFTDGDLIEVCEAPHKFLDDKRLKALGKKLKIGTPATRSNIINELITKDKYLQITTDKKAKYVIPTELGNAIYHNLKDCKICQVDMTGEWEEKLELVRNGELSLKDLELYMKKDVEHMIKDIRATPMQSISSSGGKEVIMKCPKCGGNIFSSPKSFYCENYKTGCSFGAYKMICDSKLTDKEFLALASGEHITKTLKKGSKSWKQELYYDLNECKIKFVSDEVYESKHTCPVCHCSMSETKKHIKCQNENCKFVFWKEACGVTILEEQIEQFFQTGDTGLVKGMKSKSGKSFDAHLVMNATKTGTEFKFEERVTESSDFTCPHCGKPIVHSGKVYECSDKCGFKIWTSTCGKNLTSQQIDNFFKNGETGVINGLKGKSGKSFNANIVLNEDKTGTSFKFE